MGAMKVYFVGMHNKPGLKPLDSSTITGKTIDKIIEKLPGIECVKTNMCDTDYKPNMQETLFEAAVWHDRNTLEEGDVVVLLGKWVQEYFVCGYDNELIFAPHPAGVFGNKDWYIKEISSLIEVYAHD